MISPKGVMAAEWLVFALAVILFSARVMVHIQMHMSALLLSDAILLFATLACLGVVICDTLTYRAGAMTDFTMPSISILKARFATNYLFDFGLYFPKFSMLAFYFNAIPGASSPGTRKALYAVTCFVVCSSLTTLFGDTFWCGLNPGINWSIKEGECTTFTAMPLARINWSLNIVSEVLIFVLPLPVVFNLTFSRKRERAGLMVVFLLGIVTMAVSAARFMGMLFVSNNIAIYVLATTEFAVSIMIPSLISLRPLLRKVHEWTRSANSDYSRFSCGNYSGVTSGKRRTDDSSIPTLKGSNTKYFKANGRNHHGSEVELTQQELTRIYKTEEVTVTSIRDIEFGNMVNISR